MKRPKKKPTPPSIPWDDELITRSNTNNELLTLIQMWAREIDVLADRSCSVELVNKITVISRRIGYLAKNIKLSET